jgi:hypothetical protein
MQAYKNVEIKIYDSNFNLPTGSFASRARRAFEKNVGPKKEDD